MRRILVLPVAAAVFLALFSPSADADDGDLAEAQARAQQATQEVADAETQLGTLELDINTLEALAEDARHRMDQLRGTVQEAVVERYMNSDAEQLAFAEPDLNERVRADALARTVTQGKRDAIAAYEAAAIELEAASAELVELQEEQAATLAELRSSNERLQAELVHLRELDQQRLIEEERQRQEAAEEAARLQAEMDARERAARATTTTTEAPSTTEASTTTTDSTTTSESPTSTTGSTTTSESPTSTTGSTTTTDPTTTTGSTTTSEATTTTRPPTTTTEVERPTDDEPVTDDDSTGGDESDDEADDDERPTTTQAPTTTSPPSTTRPPTTTSPPTTQAPTTTSPPTTTAPPAPPPSTSEFVCPVQGPHTFIDSWGAPRSGGRLHQGVDMMAAQGTPTVAPVSGRVEHRGTSLGGLSWYVYGDNGHMYYGTHLSGYANVGAGWVAAGTLIGYVGDTGNAAGMPHLHFEIHPNGGAAVNPYPTVAEYCR